MSTKETDPSKRNLEFLLESVDLSARIHSDSGKHVANFILVWPRMQVASRENSITLELHDGKLDLEGQPWHRKILFKEKTENRFSLMVSISESMLDTALDKFMRSMLAGLFKIGATQVGDAVAGVAGEVLSLPWQYAQKRFQESVDADIIAEGIADMDTSTLVDGGLLEIPLLSTAEVTRPLPNTSDRGPRRRKLLFHKGEQVGTITLRIRFL